MRKIITSLLVLTVISFSEFVEAEESVDQDNTYFEEEVFGSEELGSEEDSDQSNLIDQSEEMNQPEAIEEVDESKDEIKEDKSSENLEQQEEDTPEDMSIQSSNVQVQSTEPQTADEWYAYAREQHASSDRLALFIEAHNLYPNDRRFIDGINESASSLLRWATQQHRAGDFPTAVNRYERIISAPSVNDSIKFEAEWKLSLARSGTQIPSNANSWYSVASSQGASSTRLGMYIEAHRLYPSDSRFVNGINESASSLLRWATQQHGVSRFDIANTRYYRIINAPSINNNLYLEARWKEVLARQKQRIPTSANSWNQLASSQSASSDRLLLYVGAHNSYPNDSRFRMGINEGASSLLRWATQQHNAGNFNTAIDRYELILKVPQLSNDLKRETEGKLNYAKQGKTIPSSTPLLGRVVVLDPGHGGSDPGAIANGLVEKEVVLDISLRAKQLLENAGATVVMIRETDVFLSLDERARIANSANADIFISVHANAGGGTGTETFWSGRFERQNSNRLAYSLQEAVVNNMGTRNRKVEERDFVIIRDTRIPSALLEVAFLDHSDDAAKLKQSSYRQRAAKGIYEGVLNYFN